MALSDYVQLMKLRIAALLLLVAASGYIVTSGLRIEAVPFGLLMGTGLLAAGGASALNHYVDRDLDAVMRRTHGRPLPQRRIEPPTRALAFGATLSALALSISAVAINPLTSAMIGLGLLVYVGVYTLGLKRTHVSNIVIGGFAGSCPALAGSAAASNAIGLPAALIAALVFLWTPGHFWALAYRSREDYRLAGLPMLPAVRDERTTVRAIGVSTFLVPASTFSFLIVPSFGHVLYLAVAVGAGAILIALTLRFMRHPSPETAWAGYRFSGTYLAAILLALIGTAILAGPL
ncbi:MAG TPA: heme o synthase [Thermoplasmata archaeon]|nr:heme o synthase [Thermoplasmata archaeon]